MFIYQRETHIQNSLSLSFVIGNEIPSLLKKKNMEKFIFKLTACYGALIYICLTFDMNAIYKYSETLIELICLRGVTDAYSKNIFFKCQRKIFGKKTTLFA